MEDPRARRARLERMLRARRREHVEALERELGSRSSTAEEEDRLETVEIGDRSVSVHEEDVELGVLGLKREELRQIDAALVRLREGSYGDCEECGAPIEEARLEAVPFTRTCVECKRRLETEAERTRPTGWEFRSGFGDLGDERGDEEE